MVNNHPCQGLEPRIVPDIHQLPRRKAPLKYPCHAGVQEWLAAILEEDKYRTGDVLANARERLYRFASRRESTSAPCHLLCQGTKRSGPPPPKAYWPKKGLELAVRGGGKLAPTGIPLNEPWIEASDGPCRGALQEQLRNHEAVFGCRLLAPRQGSTGTEVPAKQQSAELAHPPLVASQPGADPRSRRAEASRRHDGP